MKRIAYYLTVLALAVFTFTSCEDVPSPFGQIVAPKTDDVVVVEPSGTGTQADPFNVAGVIEYLGGLGADVPSPNEVYIVGYITSITETFGTQYGNATFEISDSQEGGNKFLCYRVLYLGNQKYSDPSATNIKEGDKVVICGKVVNYKGNTPETQANGAYVYSINGTGGGGGGGTTTTTLGTKDAPITVTKALEYIAALEDNGTTKEDAYVTGKITKIKTSDANIAQYKNIDYVISDGKGELTVFRGKNLDNTDFTAAGQINVGDEVVVFGKLTKYVKDGNVTPEVAQGNYIVKLTKGGGGGGTTGEAKGTGTATDPFNIAAAIAKCKEIGETASTEKFYVKGIVVEGGKASGGFGNVTFKMGDSKDATELFTAYQVAGSDGEKLADGYEVPAGAEVVIYGPLVNYKGNTPETSGKSAAQIVTINGKKTNESSGGGGGGTTGEAKGTGTATDPFNIAAAIAKCKEIGETASTEKFYVKGIVVEGGKASGGFGNVTFKMGDSKDATELFTAYQVAGSDGEKLADGYEVPAGAEVVIYGPLVNYKGNTPETSGKSAAQIVTINGKKTNESSGGGGGDESGAPSGDGTQSSPFNIAAAIAKCKEIGSTVSSEKFYIKGIVVNGGKASGGYGNVTFDMGDTKDAKDLFKAYQVAGTNGEKLADGYEVKVGSEVIIYGPIYNYNGKTPETSGKSAAQIVTIDGKPTNDGGSGGGGGGTTSGDEITVAMNSFGLDNAADLTTLTLSDGTKLTFSQGEGTNGPKYYNSGNAARLYIGNSMTIDAGSKKITKVIINAYADNNASYTAEGNVSGKAGSQTVTPTLSETTFTFSGFSSSTLVVSNNATGTGGSKQLRIVSMTITYAK